MSDDTQSVRDELGDTAVTLMDSHSVFSWHCTCSLSNTHTHTHTHLRASAGQSIGTDHREIFELENNTNYCMAHVNLGL